MKEIVLRRRDGSTAGIAVLDDDDFERFGGMRWSFRSDGYAVRKIDGRQQALHRLVLNLPPGREGGEVDHINGNRLDNRKSNLRVATSAEQRQNQGARRPWRNVYFTSGSRKRPWRAVVKLNGRSRFIGMFAMEEEAAAAASRFRQEHMPFSNEDRDGHRPRTTA